MLTLQQNKSVILYHMTGMAMNLYSMKLSITLFTLTALVMVYREGRLESRWRMYFDIQIQELAAVDSTGCEGHWWCDCL